jgi:hypothetical protein
MPDQIEMHPHSAAGAKQLASAFDYQGVGAMDEYGQKRVDIVDSMQKELQKMPPEQRSAVKSNLDNNLI